jgi:hypothetical protein
MFWTWFGKPQPIRSQSRGPDDPEDLLAYMSHYYPIDNSIEAKRRCIQLAIKDAVEGRARARRKRFRIVSSDRSD